MKKAIFSCFFIPVFCICCGLLAAEKSLAADINESSARIDINSENSAFSFTNVSSNGQCNVADWVPVKEQPKNWLTQMALRLDEEWQELWIEFTPSASGYVVMQLRGSYYPDIKKNRHEVWVDDVTVQGKGAALVNGSFEYLRNPNGNLIGWAWADLSGAKYRQVPEFAKHGKNCILVWHDNPVIAKIAVKAGEKYKISAWFRPNYKKPQKSS
ncbi:MAG: hypothetical protein WC532_04410 [Candidatus Omnitrophota bacterium]